jgi:hypothetical protein
MASGLVALLPMILFGKILAFIILYLPHTVLSCPWSSILTVTNLRLAVLLKDLLDLFSNLQLPVILRLQLPIILRRQPWSMPLLEITLKGAKADEFKR